MVTTDQVKEEISDVYHLDALQVEKLEGYGSLNFRITEKSGRKCVFKKYSNEADFNLVKEEIRILNSISKYLDFFVPVTQSTADGNLSFTDSTYHLSRLLNYIDGDFLFHQENTPELLFSFGKSIAQLAKILQDYDSAEVKSRRLSWDLQYFYLNFPLAKYITDSSDRKLVDYFFDQFKQIALEELPYLRHGLIHGDLHDLNVLVSDSKVSGFIDFGDISYAPLIADLAIAITYIMLNNRNPIEAASSVIRGYHSVLHLEEKEINLLPLLVTTRLCISVCHSAEAKMKSSDTEYILISEKPAWQLLNHWITFNPIAITNAFREAASLERIDLSVHKKNILEKRKKYFGKSLSLSYSEPVYFTGAAFQYMYDGDGNAYLDAYNNIPHVGHSHPKVSEAASKQIRKLNTNTRYYYDSLALYAEKLLGYFPDRLNKIYLVNSGSAANDLALRMANTYTNVNNHVVLESGYHGHTISSIGVSSYKFEGKGGKGIPGNVTRLPLPKLFNGQYSTAEQYIEDAKARISKAGQLSSFIFEPVSGCGGQVTMPDGYMKNIFPLIKQHGGVTICDEVQTGFGRLGDFFWGFEMNDVIPDIVVLGKPMGNGHPVAAVVVTEEIADAFANGMEFFSSFGGNTVSAEIAMAVLNIIEEEKLQLNAKETGEYFINELKSLQKLYPRIGDVRGSGFFTGIEFVSKENQPDTAFAKYVKDSLKKRFILTGTDGKYVNVIKIKPPMCFSKQNADHFISVLDDILKSAL